MVLDDDHPESDSASFQSCVDDAENATMQNAHHHLWEGLTTLELRIRIQQLEKENKRLRARLISNNQTSLQTLPLAGRKKKWVPYEVVRDIVSAMIFEGSKLEIDLRQHPFLVIPLVSRSFREAYFDFFTNFPSLRFNTIRQNEVIFCNDASFPGRAVRVWPGTVRLLANHGRLTRLKHVDISTWSFADIACHTRFNGSSIDYLLHLVARDTATKAGQEEGGDGVEGSCGNKNCHALASSLVLNTVEISFLKRSEDQKTLSIDYLLGLNASTLKFNFGCKSPCRPPITVPIRISGTKTGSRDLGHITCIRIACESYGRESFGEDFSDWCVPLFTYLLSACGGLKQLHVVLKAYFCAYDPRADECFSSCYRVVREISERVLTGVPAITSAAASIWVEFKLKFAIGTARTLDRNSYPLLQLGQLKSLEDLDGRHFEMTREIIAVDEKKANNSSNNKNEVDSSWISAFRFPKSFGKRASATRDGGEGMAAVGSKVVSFTVKTKD